MYLITVKRPNLRPVRSISLRPIFAPISQSREIGIKLAPIKLIEAFGGGFQNSALFVQIGVDDVR